MTTRRILNKYFRIFFILFTELKTYYDAMMK